MSREDVIALAKVRLEEMLSFFGYNVHAEVVELDGDVELRVPSDDSGRLIGHHGETLRAIQHIINMIVRNATSHSHEHLYISVDIAGYKQARAKALGEQGIAAADRVAASGEEQALAPMSAAERRMVHMAIADRTDVVTESRGEEPKRFIVIKPRA